MPNNEGEVQTIYALTVEQTKYSYWRKATKQVRLIGSKVHIDHNALLEPTWKMDDGQPEVVPVSLRERVLYAESGPLISGHSDKLHMY